MAVADIADAGLYDWRERPPLAPGNAPPRTKFNRGNRLDRQAAGERSAR